MNQRNIFILGVSIAIGLIAIFLANSYFSGVVTRQEQQAEQARLARIVVATQELAFGMPLSAQNLRLVNWPANSVPTGAFTTIEQATKNNRVALRPIVVGEPVLASKVSGLDGRATLSANLPAGKVAYTMPIDAVAGVGGFVRPGDVVDVLLTRQIPGEGATGADKMVDVILESVPVLGIDLISNENDTEAKNGKTATLQVDTMGAQKLALARELGNLSLTLRNVTDQLTGTRSTVIARQLSPNRYYIPAKRTSSGSSVQLASAASPMRSAMMPGNPFAGSTRPRGPSMVIVRGGKSSEYEVQRGY